MNILISEWCIVETKFWKLNILFRQYNFQIFKHSKTNEALLYVKRRHKALIKKGLIIVDFRRTLKITNDWFMRGRNFWLLFKDTNLRVRKGRKGITNKMERVLINKNYRDWKVPVDVLTYAFFLLSRHATFARVQIRLNVVLANTSRSSHALHFTMPFSFLSVAGAALAPLAHSPPWEIPISV